MSLNTFLTWTPSSLRSKPLSIKIHLRFFPYRLMDKHRGYRGIHPAAQSADYPFLSHRLLDSIYRIFDKRLDIPSSGTAAYPKEKISHYFISFRGVGYLRMKLHSVNFSFLSAIAAWGVFKVWAIVLKPWGSLVMQSPWLIQQVRFPGR